MPGSRSAWSGTQWRSHSQIDTSTGHSDRLRGGDQVLGPRRIRLVGPAVQQAVARQRLQPAGQHRIRNRQPRHEFAVPRRAQQGLLDDQQRPLVAEQAEHPPDGVGAAHRQFRWPRTGLLHLQSDRARRRSRRRASAAAPNPAPTSSGCRWRSVPAAPVCTPGRRRPGRRRTPGSRRRRRSCRWSA